MRNFYKEETCLKPGIDFTRGIRLKCQTETRDLTDKSFKMPLPKDGCRKNILGINLTVTTRPVRTLNYYMDRSVLLKTKTLVESINHYIREPSDVFSVCHSRE